MTSNVDWSCGVWVKRYFGRKDKRKEAKWKTTMQNTRLDEEETMATHIRV